MLQKVVFEHVRVQNLQRYLPTKLTSLWRAPDVNSHFIFLRGQVNESKKFQSPLPTRHQLTAVANPHFIDLSHTPWNIVDEALQPEFGGRDLFFNVRQ